MFCQQQLLFLFFGFFSLIYSYVTDNYKLRLTNFGHRYKYYRLEIRQLEGEWGTICCSTYCSIADESKDYITDLRDVCRMLGYVSVIGIRHDLETGANTTSVHLSLDYYKQRELDTNVSSLYDLGISEWYRPNCDGRDNVYLSCLSGMCSYKSNDESLRNNVDWGIFSDVTFSKIYHKNCLSKRTSYRSRSVPVPIHSSSHVLGLELVAHCRNRLKQFKKNLISVKYLKIFD